MKYMALNASLRSLSWLPDQKTEWRTYSTLKGNRWHPCTAMSICYIHAYSRIMASLILWSWNIFKCDSSLSTFFPICIYHPLLVNVKNENLIYFPILIAKHSTQCEFLLCLQPLYLLLLPSLEIIHQVVRHLIFYIVYSSLNAKM